jgi:DNA-binding NarL/FixJ family response regulator
VADVRVLVGEFGAIGAVGLGELLDAEGLEFVLSGLTARGVLAKVAEGETEVVVLDREMPQARGTAERIAAEHAGVRVIVCSLDDTTMSVYPGRGGEAYEAPLDPPRLAAAIRSGGELAG